MVDYLKTPIAAVKRTEAPRYGVTLSGYSKRSGAPTGYLVRLQGESRWRRVMVWQFSNAGTMFVRVGGRPLVLSHYDIEAAERARAFRGRASSWFAEGGRDRRRDGARRRR